MSSLLALCFIQGQAEQKDNLVHRWPSVYTPNFFDIFGYFGMKTVMFVCYLGIKPAANVLRRIVIH